MWGDVVIGQGNKGCTAILVSEIIGEHGIYQNNNSYWISECIFNTSITIFKDDPEGIFLGGLITAKAPLKEIMDHINCLVMKNILPQVLILKIEAIMAKEYLRGKQDKLIEIRAALEL